MSRFGLVNLVLIAAVVLLAAAPLMFVKGDYTGADDQARAAIAEDNPGYEPWFAPIYEPPSAEVASGLFALQAAIGAGVIGYFFGVARTRRRYAAGVGQSPADGRGAGRTAAEHAMPDPGPAGPAG